MKVSADIYDSIELVAEAYDGVGSDMYTEWANVEGEHDQPGCATGMLMWAKGFKHAYPAVYTDPDIKQLESITGSNGTRSDEIVNRYIDQHGDKRMPFHLWAPAVGLERGD